MKPHNIHTLSASARILHISLPIAMLAKAIGYTGGHAALVTPQTSPCHVSMSGVTHHLRPRQVCRCAHHRSGLHIHFSYSNGTQ